jgi:hypothetical protein
VCGGTHVHFGQEPTVIDGQPDLDLFDPLTEKFVVTLVAPARALIPAAAAVQKTQPGCHGTQNSKSRNQNSRSRAISFMSLNPCLWTGTKVSGVGAQSCSILVRSRNHTSGVGFNVSEVERAYISDSGPEVLGGSRSFRR